jgi:hypothetical protein
VGHSVDHDGFRLEQKGHDRAKDQRTPEVPWNVTKKKWISTLGTFKGRLRFMPKKAVTIFTNTFYLSQVDSGSSVMEYRETSHHNKTRSQQFRLVFW